MIDGLQNDRDASQRKPGVLIADDMGLILTLLKFELEPRGFVVWLALDGDDALDLYRQHRAEIDVVLLDVQMAGLDGPATLAAIQRTEPEILACFMTGDSGAYQEENLLACGARRVFKKPFHVAEVALCLQELVETANAAAPPASSTATRRMSHALTETIAN